MTTVSGGDTMISRSITSNHNETDTDEEEEDVFQSALLGVETWSGLSESPTSPRVS